MLGPADAGLETATRVTPLREAEPAPHPPPTNVEAEQALLGAIFVNNAAYGRVSDFLAPEHFAIPVHGRIYAAAAGLIDRGEPADPIRLKAAFDRDEALTALGGAQYLAALAASAVTILNAIHYGHTIRDLYARRQMILAAEDLTAAALDVAAVEKSAQEILEQHETALGAILGPTEGRRVSAIGAAARESIAQTEVAYQAGGKITGIETGLVDLDRLLGGLLPGNLEIIAGRPSMGKTSLAAGIALNAARSGIPSGIFSLEETAAQQAQRIVAMESDVPTDRQRRGDLDMVHWARLVEAQGRIDRLPIYIDETAGQTAPQLRRRIRDMVRLQHIKFAVIDHLQLIRAGSRIESRRVEVGEITRILKETAKEYGIPIVLLSQLSRAVEQRDNKRPLLSDLRESGDIEADADRVIFVYRPEYYLSRGEPERRAEETGDRFNERHVRWKETCEATYGIAELILAKNRFGPTGTVRVHWNAELTRFSSLARQGDFDR